jgi:hypothetical protein
MVKCTGACIDQENISNCFDLSVLRFNFRS